MTRRCSIVIPVHNRAALTRQCLETVLGSPPEVAHEIIVVDDASDDSTSTVLAQFGEAINVVARTANGGFASACNDGAAVAGGEYLVFLNNDTIPRQGWLDALVAYADGNPKAAVVGSKLLFPNDTVQHAGVVICQDGRPRHLYAGFPPEHPAVNKSRRFKAVTAACALVRREPFEQVGGFDTAFHNCLEDVDLCLRLGELGHEVHYCNESVLYHLESVSRGGQSELNEVQLYSRRWKEKLEPDDLDYYLEDGLLRLHYRDLYPLPVEISPLLASLDGERENEAERLLESRSRQVAGLLKETVRLTAQIAELELAGEAARPDAEAAESRKRERPAPAALAHDELLRHAERIELDIYDLQAELVAALGENGSGGHSSSPDLEAFRPSEYLGYRKLLGPLRDVVAAHVPPEATVLIASRGDDELLNIEGRRVWHFPQDENGEWTGYHPSDSGTAIAHLEELRARGAQYVVFPQTALWWLDHYREFGEHLRSRYRSVVADEEVCAIFALGRD